MKKKGPHLKQLKELLYEVPMPVALSHLLHDLNQPMIIVKASLEQIHKATEDRELRKLASLGLDGVLRSQEMLKYFLDAYYHEPQARKKFETFRPCDIARALIDLQLHEVGKRFRLVDEFIEIHWDREAFTRILENLLTNAIKFGSPDTPVTIKFPHTRDSFCIEVHNFGPYITESEQKRIFDRYYRGKAAKGKEGWGIGLHIVKELVEAYGGSVRMKSSPKEGTLFIVQLPVELK